MSYKLSGVGKIDDLILSYLDYKTLASLMNISTYQTIKLSGIKDIDNIIVSYADIETLTELVHFANVRSGIITILPDIATDLIKRHIDKIRKQPKSRRKINSEIHLLIESLPYQDILRQLAKLTLMLLHYYEYDVMIKIDELIKQLTEQDNFCDTLGICLLRDVGLEGKYIFSEIMINNYINYMREGNFFEFVKYFKRILYNGLFEIDEKALYTYYHEITFPEDILINYIKRFLKPAMDYKIEEIITFVCYYWEKVTKKHNFESTKLKLNMDLMVAKAAHINEEIYIIKTFLT